MSKKAGNKAKAKAPEIDPNSPEWIEEVARKQTEAYDMVQRAMTRSQIDAVLATRDDLMKQRAELETKAKQQSQDQSDIYQYLRNKLKDNYVAIAELETKVSEAHDERLLQEKQLLATIKDLDEDRESEKTQLEERLATLDVELTAIKEYQENSEVYQQTLRDMEAKIASCKDAFTEEVALLNQQLEDECETGRRDKEERRKITKKAAARATQEQLGPRTKIRIAQNKKMMSELRFQCFEVEKMHRARQGLMKSNTHLLAQAASARHRVEELARRSHLLQRIIRYMHQKLHTRCGSQGDLSREEESDSATPVDSPGGHQQRDRSPATGARPGGVGGGGSGGGGGGRDTGGRSGALYKLAGMSEEERQQMLDLREELRCEEVGIADAQTLVAELRKELLTAEAERSRALALRTDLARVLASCHEDPSLGTDVGNRSTTGHGCTRQAPRPGPRNVNPAHVSQSPASVCVHPEEADSVLPESANSSSFDEHTATTFGAGGLVGCNGGDGERAAEGVEASTCQGPELGKSSGSAALLPAIVPGRSSQPQPGREERQETMGQQPRQAQPQLQYQQQPESAISVVGTEGNSGEPQDAVNSKKRAYAATGGALTLWPETSILPPAAAPVEAPSGAEGARGQGPVDAPCVMDAETLKSVARLFLSKLQISVEEITPRHPVPAQEATGFPALMSGVASDGRGESDFGIAGKHPRSSKRGTRRRRRGSKGGKRVGTSGGGVVDHTDNRNRNGQCGLSSRDRAGTSGGGDRHQIAYHRTGEGFGGSRHGRGQRRGWPDDATSWSDWHTTTGIPSWDILEPSVRQTKRRRTRDAACQTLTYRELRDNAHAAPFTRANLVGWKNGGKKPNRPHEDAQQPHLRRGRLQKQTPPHHEPPATRFVSMLNPPPGSPLSSAATVSTASVYRVTGGGGLVHGAIVRGGGGTGRKQRPPGRQGRIGGGGDDNAGGAEAAGRVPRAEAFPLRGAHAAAVSSETTMTARPQKLDMPLDGHGTLLCSPPHSPQDNTQETQDQGNQDSTSSPPGYPYRRPETTDNQRSSPPVAQVAVSWGQGPEREESLEDEQGSPSTAERAPEMEVPSYTRGGGGPESFGGDLEAGYQDMVAGIEGHGGGLAYEPLSKGPDYRKVLLYTVNDTDCRILRRNPTTDDSKRPAADGTGVVTTPSAHGDDSGTPRTAYGKRGTSRSSSSRQRGGSVSVGANFVKSVSSSTAATRTKGRFPVVPSRCRPDGDDLFVGNGSKVPGNSVGRGKSRGDVGAILAAGVQNSIVWDKDIGEDGIDSGPMLCSSMSTLSGDAF